MELSSLAELPELVEGSPRSMTLGSWLQLAACKPGWSTACMAKAQRPQGRAPGLSRVFQMYFKIQNSRYKGHYSEPNKYNKSRQRLIFG